MTLEEVGTKETFEIFYLVENYLGVIYEKTIHYLNDDSKTGHESMKTLYLMKPLFNFREKIVKEFNSKSQSAIYDYKEILLSD